MRLNPIYQGIMCCALALPTAAAFAQQGSGQVLEEIVVTGSLIRGIPEDAAMPVDTISADDLDKQGAPPPLEMLKSLSYMNGIVGEANNFSSGRGQAAQGTASINLRGLGASRTLVLLNGKRVASSDANRLPTNAIARVEVLKDGGAVTYGSDAIAGVVNYITKTNQDGFEFSADYRAIDDSDGDYNIGLSWGTSTDNSDFFISLNHYHRSQLKIEDVDWALTPYAKNPEGGWSGGANPGNFRGAFLGFIPDPNNPGKLLMNWPGFVDPGCENFGGEIIGGTCRTRYTDWYNLVDEQDSYQFFTSYDLQLGNDTTLHLEALWASTEVPEASSAGSYMPINYVPNSINPAGAWTDSAGTGVNAFYNVPANNPGLMALLAANPHLSATVPNNAYITLAQWRPFFTGGNPAYGYDGAWTDYDREQFRLSAELRGMLTDTIGYTTSLTYGESESTRRERDIRIDRLQLALNGQGGPNGDLWLNPFSNGVPGAPKLGLDNPDYDPSVANDPALAAWLMDTHRSDSTGDTLEFNFVADGDSGIELAGGSIGWAAGYQYRREGSANKYGANSDATVHPCPDFESTTCVGLEGRSPYTYLGTYTPYDIDRDVHALFGELMIPITDNLTAQLAARYEDYGDAGGDSFDPNLRLRWQATDWLAFRGSAGTTFRVAPQTSLRAVESTGFAGVLGANRAVSSTGNPDLEPEEAKNYNLGVMFTGLNHSLTIDYWRFELDKRLTTEPLNGVLDKVFPNGADATLPNNCGMFPEFEAKYFEFANNQCAASAITKVMLTSINGSGIVNDGVDIAGHYNWDDIGPGYLTVGGSATWINQFKTEKLIRDGIVFEEGFDGVGKFNSGTSLMPLPEWRGSLFVNYTMDRQNIRWTMNYVDSYEDQRNIFTTYKEGQKIDSHITHTLTYRLDVNDNVTVNAVLDNVFDEEPPFARTELNYDPVTHSPLTRTFKIGAKVRF